MTHAQIVDCVNYMPERVVRNDTLPEGTTASDVDLNAFFRGIRERRFASPDYTSGRLGALAAKRLIERNGVKPAEIDCIITACVLTDLLANGIGADVQKQLGAHSAKMLNIDTNCTSWLACINVARAFVEAGIYKKVVVVTVTNFVSRLTEFQKSKRSWPLGDGASATLVVAGEKSILGFAEQTNSALYGHMRLEPDAAPDGCYRNYWEGGPGALTVNFSQELLDRIRVTATETLPNMVRKLLSDASLSTSDVDMLITHQPNRIFVDGWRQALGIVPPRAHDTLEIYGNMFLGTIPVTLADAIEKNLVKRGDLIVAATFANAGDHVAAIAFRW